MEIEVKYALPSEEILENIWSDRYLMEISDNASEERIKMHAVYYDTQDLLLRNAGITLRVRAEGDTAFATIKWGGSSSKGLHVREEINIPVSPDAVLLPPDLSLISQTEKGKEIADLSEGKGLVPILSMDFTRSRKRLSFEGNIIELALDCGEINARNGKAPILEMELEHYAGPDSSSVEKLGEKLAETYKLSTENRSKYARGLALS